MVEWLQQLPQRSQLLVQAVAELLVNTVPMPWRVSVTLLIVIILVNLIAWRLLPWVLRLLVNVLFWIVELVVSLLLLPEYLVTRLLRTFGWGPLWGSYLYGDLLSGVVQLFHAPVDGISQLQQRRFPWFVFMLLAVLPVGLWYARPSMEGMDVARYVDVGFQWWYQLEGWLLRDAVYRSLG